VSPIFLKPILWALTGGKARAQNVISNRKYCPETEFPLSFSKGNSVP
jgi:hypothetical protein